MSWNPFKKIADRRRRKKEADRLMRSLQELSVVFETLNKFRQARLLYVDFKRNTVTIAQSLAEFYIYDEEAWQNFLRQLNLWATYEYSVMEYTKQFSKVKADAEAAAFREKGSALDDGEKHIARMRAVAAYDAEQGGRSVALPEIQFVVLGAADGEPICVARLINGRFETAVVPD